ncbi:MAG TPA: PadR family transcriptional regulator [Steroidobacteraceae bacterium]|nr:PadR family transcriptional regulator [Steroidobacteraceae bacterium]
MAYAELLSGLIEFHVLHHAAEGDIFGLWMIKELKRHGYRISPGTLYPLLHRLKHRGYLSVHEVKLGRTRRRMYRATKKGHLALAVIRRHVLELTKEINKGS